MTTDIELISRFKEQGDIQARNELVKRYMPMIKSQINLRFGSGTIIPKTAIESEGIAQVIKAIDNYNPMAGAAFSTHLFNYLRKMSRYVNTYGHTIRQSEEVFGLVSKFKEAQSKLRNKLNREPSIPEMSAELKMSEHQVNRILPQIKDVQIDMGFDAGKHTSTLIEDYVDYTRTFDMTPKEIIVFDGSTGFKGAQKKKAGELAKELNVSPAQISHIKNKIGDKLSSAFAVGEIARD
jgi:DNA-directed RNA polymerase specialized sigma subunit